MKLKQLECVVAIVQNGFSVTAAAESLHMSQPAVSKQVKLLEESLGVILFKRNSKSFASMTEIGDEILPEIDKVLSHVENIKRLGAKNKEARFSQLNFATTTTLAQYQLQSRLAVISQHFPNMPLNIIETTNTQILQMLQTHEADFGWFSANDLAPYQSMLKQIIYLPASKWSPTLIVPKGHKLGKIGINSLSDLGKYPLITYITSHKGPSGLAKAMREAGVAAKIVLTARNPDMIKSYVRQGIGIGVIADIAYNAKTDDDLIALPLKKWLGDYQTYLAWHQEKRLRDMHYQLIKHIVPFADKEYIRRHISKLKAMEENPGWAI